MRVYRKRGINGFANAKVETVERTKDGVAVTFTVDGKQQKIEADKVLIAVGRAPRTENVGIEKTKIEVERGFVKVNQFMQTAEPGIYAIGDIAMGYPQLAHAGAAEGILAVTHIAGKPVKPIKVNRIPNDLPPPGNRERWPHRSQGQGTGLRRRRSAALHRQLAPPASWASTKAS
jgi:dihydrolipoamide dehydrogenase